MEKEGQRRIKGRRKERGWRVREVMKEKKENGGKEGYGEIKSIWRG